MANRYIDMALLQQYVRGELDAAQMHEVEEAALEDVFVQDALDGLYYARNGGESYSLLQKRLHERTLESHATNKHFNKITWPRLAVGSAAAVVCILGTLLFTINRQKQQSTARSERKVEVALQDKGSPEVAVVQPQAKAPAQTDIVNKPTAERVTQVEVVTARATKPKVGWDLPKRKTAHVTVPHISDTTTATAVASAVAEAPAYANTSELPTRAGTMATGLPGREFTAKSMGQERSIGAERATLTEVGTTAVQINPRIEGTLNRSLAVPNAGLATIMLQQNRAVVNSTHTSVPVAGWSSFFTTLSRQVTGSYPRYVTLQITAQGRPVITGFAPGTSEETQGEFTRALSAAGGWRYMAGEAGSVKLWFNF